MPPTGEGLKGRRLLVVGSSSGIGRATGIAAAAHGARVAFAARRAERLDEAAAAAGSEAIALECDVRDEGSVHAAVAKAAERFEGLDALVYAAGISSFVPLAELGEETWRAVLDTNLVGAALVTRAAIPHLDASRGKAVFFSSIAIDDRPPRYANAPYVVSKVALETLVQAWQGEHPRVGFTAIAMGDTVTEFASDADPEHLAPIVTRWIDEGYMYGRAMDVATVAEQIVGVLRSPETIRRIAITPRYAAEEDAQPTDVLWDRPPKRPTSG